MQMMIGEGKHILNSKDLFWIVVCVVNHSVAKSLKIVSGNLFLIDLSWIFTVGFFNTFTKKRGCWGTQDAHSSMPPKIHFPPVFAANVQHQFSWKVAASLCMCEPGVWESSWQIQQHGDMAKRILQSWGENVQKRFTKTIKGLVQLHVERSLWHPGLLSLQRRWVRGWHDRGT